MRTPVTSVSSVLALASLLAVAGCLDSVGVICDDGTLCPDGTTCTLVGGDTRCVTGEQRDQCAGKPDQTACSYAGVSDGLCHDQVCVRAGCGDGFATGSEQCDGNDLAGVTDCTGLGYYQPGTISCASDCRFDRTGCDAAGKCGDGVVNGDEQCDCPTDGTGTHCTAAQLGGETCSTAGGYYSPEGLSCNSACRFEFTACHDRCGDGVADATHGEECDGADLGGNADCTDLGYYGAGTLKCQANCVYDRATCAPQGVCGDGVVNGTEQCDGTAFAPAFDACGKLQPIPGHPYYGGTIACLPNCRVDASACSGFCGDGQVNGPEACDRFDFAGKTCATYNRYSGSLACDAACGTIDAGQCTGYCGDGVLNGSETCDTGNGGVFPAGVDCRAYGYHAGTLGCVACTTTSTTPCEAGGYCGDGIVQDGEACDGLDQGGLDCANVSARGPLDCDGGCQRAFGTCEDSAWLRRVLPTSPLGRVIVRDVWSQNAAAAWVVGDPGVVFQWEGTRWIDRSPPAASPLFMIRTVWGQGDTIWIGGDGSQGGIARWVWPIGAAPGHWVAEPGSPGQISDLYGVDGRLFAATDNGLYERSPAGIWSLARTSTNQPIVGRFAAIDGREGVVYAVGQGMPNAFRRVGGSWTPVTIINRDYGTPQDLQAVSVLAPDRVLVIPQNGSTSVTYWDGVQGWPLGTGPVTGNASLSFTRVYAAAEDDVWILGTVTSGGQGRPVLYHSTGYSAQLPQAVEVPLGSLPDSPILAGFGAGDVWIAGDGAVLRNEGPSWRTPVLSELRPQGQGSQIADLDFTSLAVTSAGMWAGGCLRDGSGNCVPAASGANLLEHRLGEGGLLNMVPIAYTQYRAAPAACGLCTAGNGPPEVPALEAVAIDSAGWVRIAGDGKIAAVANTLQRLAPPAAPPAFGPIAADARFGGGWATGAHAYFGVIPAPAMIANLAMLAHWTGAAWTTMPIVDANDPAAYLTTITAISGTGPSDI